MQHTLQNKWSCYALDSYLWDEYNAPIIKISKLSSMDINECGGRGILSDQIIGAYSSFLTIPTTHRYVTTKCDLTKLNLINIAALRKYHYLQYIDLTHNNLTDLSPLSEIPYLLYLNASHNNLEDISKFRPPRYLTYLNLSHNNVTSMKSLESFWSIISLDLSHNFIKKIPKLHNLRYLKYLNLSYNAIEYVQNLEYLNIQELNLEFNCVKKFIFTDLDKRKNAFINLKILLISHNNISSLKFFRNIYCLRLVDLKSNKIVDLMEISHLSSLVYEIDLRDNPCTKWPNYKEVVIFSMPSVIFIDRIEVTDSERVSAAITFNPPIKLLASRGLTQLTLLEQLNVPKIDNSIISYDEQNPPLIILNGPSAVKKLALGLHISSEKFNKMKYCRSHTTRKISTHDNEKKAYHFVDREEFNSIARNGEFLTIEELVGDSYGFHRNEIAELKKENKIGITQMDLLAAIQMKVRYPQVKLILVLTKNEEIHRQWIEDKFRIFEWIKDSIENLWALTANKQKHVSNAYSTANKNNIISSLIDDIITRIDIPSHSMDIQSHNSKSVIQNVISQNESMLQKLTTISYKLSTKKKYITIINPQSFQKSLHQSSSTDDLSNSTKRIRMPSQEYSQKKAGKLLSGEKFKSIDNSFDRSLQTYDNIKDPKNLMNEYVESIIKSRQIYLDQHLNNPGFYSLVLYSDDFDGAVKSLKHFINRQFKHSTFKKPRQRPETDHTKYFTTSTIDEIINELRRTKKSINN
ncbi:leucine-rich repeat and guanylate kinase domain-containing protein-like [Microplitis mediator]|uniref:leucine-rich repeat and guanylate kinase domain-containing protein-like n=1 Tax=Microplitis mediator TaxID=375433 RepID=UPI002556ECF0|nr:leucine-rich repeat and guanylate kinase domain-containing protein-like [Microplitis mediator]